MPCATSDCGVPSCPVCIHERPDAPTPEDLRWQWLREQGMSEADIAIVRAASDKAKTKRAAEHAKAEKKGKR